jgi:protein-S-isoprenylcysteine O-methyltransferase Ste14
VAPKVGIQIGKLVLTGPAALLVTLLFAAALGLLIVEAHPSTGMLLAGGIWAGFFVFWTLTAKPKGEVQRQESAQSRGTHRLLMNLGLLLLFVPIPRLRQSFLSPNSWHVIVGLGTMVLATMLHIWARLHLGMNWSSQVMIKVDHQLVQTGPYRLIRHPIYTAILGLAFGTALVSGRITSLAGAVLISVAYVRKLLLEEQGLAETFGDEWQTYRKTSWRLIPPVY